MAARPNFAGYWAQDKERSDKDDKSFDIIEAGFMLRKGVHAVRGIEIEIVPDEYFQFAVVTIVPFFKITERYPLDGEAVEQKRRDLRSGKHLGKAEWSRNGKELHITFTFDGELGGSGSDVFKLVSEDELHVVHSLENKNGKNVITKIYTRKK